MFPTPQLPYAPTALEPFLSGETMSAHIAKHQSYVRTVNRLLAPTIGVKGSSMFLLAAWAQQNHSLGLAQAASQAFAHDFFWHSMRPPQRQRQDPKGVRAKRAKQNLERIYKGDDMVQDGVELAKGLFGSGWLWLVLHRGCLEWRLARNAEMPFFDHRGTVEKAPILCVDLWEHAYYIDYPNRMTEFLSVFFDCLCDWRMALQRLSEVR